MKNLFWFRRDLRLEDNVALYQSLLEGEQVLPVFIIEKDFISSLDTGSSKVHFLFDAVKKLAIQLNELNSKLIIRFGDPINEITNLIKEANIDTVYFNRNYEIYELQRDERFIYEITKAGYQVKTYKDQVVFEKNELDTDLDFVSYKKAWQKKIRVKDYKQNNFIDTNKFIKIDSNLLSLSPPSPDDYNFDFGAKYKEAGEKKALTIINESFDSKNFYYENNFFDFYSFISPYLHFGNLSVRQLIAKIKSIYRFTKRVDKNKLDQVIEQIIKNNYSSQLYNSKNNKIDFISEFSDLELNNDYKSFFIWCNGKTGYPIIDAAIIQLNQEGNINTNLKVLSAEFLVNILKIDRKLGKRYFIHKLIDSDYSIESDIWDNINSPELDLVKQSVKFDPKGDFIKKYIPELGLIPEKFIHNPYKMPINLQKKLAFIIGKNYPLPIVKLKEDIQKIDIVIEE